MRLRTVATVAVAAVALSAPAGDPPPAFHRVHVPAGRVADVPLGGERYVPMPLADFDAAVTRARAAAGESAAEPAPPASAARWTVALDEAGDLAGLITVEVGSAAAGPGRLLPLGGLRVTRAVLRTEPPREAAVFGADGRLAVSIPEPGTYAIEFTCPPEAPGQTAFRLPLVPALATSVAIALPPGLRPVLAGAAARHAVVSGGENGAWTIETGPAAEMRLGLESRDRPAPPVAIWADVSLSGPRAELAATVVPAAAWGAGRLVLAQDPALRVSDVRVAADATPLDHETAADGRSVSITLPRWFEGTRGPLVVRGVAPATGRVWRLPLLAAGGGGWAGGGAAVRIDPAFVVRDAELEECRAVAPEVAAAWPLPDRDATAAGAARAAAWHVEQQGPAARLDVEIDPRSASFDVARVTTVDILPGSVRGRVACDVRVIGGEAFEITGRVAPGWIIDAVDAVDWSAADDSVDEPAAPTPADRVVDWRVVPSPVGDALRIGLTRGATAGRGIGLRISGHRAGLAPGAVFTTADIDMVRFDGESPDAAVVDLRTGADAFVEIDGRPAGWFEVPDRLAPLVEADAPRGRIGGGDRAADVEARVVRRRPPLDVAVEVRLETRDDAVVQAFTFDCQAATGVESIVVDFAEPGGSGLAWRVEAPEGVIARARPLDPAEGGLASRNDAVAESWLVELDAAVTGPLRIRAVRTVPFAAAVPVPLAWVEGATEPGGRIVVVAPAGTRPRVEQRRLRELPSDPAAAAAPAEFAYGPPQAGVGAELLPGEGTADARAWAWRETVACWCDESGATESESRFEIENEGRGSVALSLAPGRRLESVLVGGAPPPGVEFGPAGGTWRIPLPRDRRRVEIVVRTLSAGRPGRYAWRVEPAGASLDLPVLARDVRLLVPPGLVIASPAADDSARPSWSARLLGLGGPGDAAASPTGFREESVTAIRERGPGVLLVRRRVLASLAILAFAAAGVTAFLRSRWAPAAAWLYALAPAVAALWLPPAFVPVARAAWWGALAGLAWGLGRGSLRSTWWRWRARRAAAAAALVVAVGLTPAAADDAGLRVFVTPGDDGGTALVPEPLFRALARFAAPESAAIRVHDCRVTARRSADTGSTWDVALEVDADVGGTLVLDAGAGAGWLSRRDDGAGIDVALEGRTARLTARAGGRHAVELRVAPAVERRGPVETETAGIPVAPRAAVEVADDGGAAGAVACERALGDGPFTPAGSGGPAAFDVAASDRVRLARPVDPRDRLAAGPRAAETLNELSWDARGCGVAATIDLDAGTDLLRSFVVRMDPRLVDLVAVEPAASLAPLAGGCVRVEFAEPVRGRVRVGLEARLPLGDPVGVFEAPGIWVEGLPVESRSIRLAAADEFDAALDPPPAAGATAADLDARPPARVSVRRRRPQVRATQSLAVAFAPGGVDMELQAQIDAAAALVRIPVDVPVGSTVDRVELLADDPAAPAAREPVDIAWTRTTADRVLVVVQQPRPGRFRLEVQARLARRPASRARLPVIRARLADATPLVVSWTAQPPLAVAVEGPVPVAGTVLEIPEGAADPDYVLTVAEEPAPAEPPAPAAAGDDSSRVEAVEVRLVFEARGRLHGLARFDVVGAPDRVRLRLPAGTRLFDVLVDGRVAVAEPRAADTWDLPLGSAPWPRTILAVFAGDAGRAAAEGPPLSLEPPRLEGLPAPETLWSVSAPPGTIIDVLPPARPLSGAAAAEFRAAGRERVAVACERAAAAATGVERDRLEALAALRRDDGAHTADESWMRAAGWDTAQPAAGDRAVAAAAPLEIRLVRASDPTLPARAIATVSLVAVAGFVWTRVLRGRRIRN